MLVTIVTTNLVSAQEIAAHPETALVIAAEPFLGQLGFTLIAVAALFSTGGAINATLFSSAEFATRLVSHDLLPDRFSDPRTEGTPEKSLVVLGTLAALFTAVGSLQGIHLLRVARVHYRLGDRQRDRAHRTSAGRHRS